MAAAFGCPACHCYVGCTRHAWSGSYGSDSCGCHSAAADPSRQRQLSRSPGRRCGGGHSGACSSSCISRSWGPSLLPDRTSLAGSRLASRGFDGNGSRGGGSSACAWPCSRRAKVQWPPRRRGPAGRCRCAPCGCPSPRGSRNPCGRCSTAQGTARGRLSRAARCRGGCAAAGAAGTALPPVRCSTSWAAKPHPAKAAAAAAACGPGAAGC